MTPTGGVIFLLAMGAIAPDLHAVAFSVPLSTEGVVFVPGGVTVMPQVDNFATDPIHLRIEPGDLLFLSPGEIADLRVTAIFRDNHEEDVTAHVDTEYSVADIGIINVDGVGQVAAIGSGETNIQIRHGNLIVPKTARVRPDLGVASLEPIFNFRDLNEMVPEILPEHSKAMIIGATVQLDVRASLTDGTPAHLRGLNSTIFTSDDESVAAVDARGIVLAAGIGATTIHVESHGHSTAAVVLVGDPDITAPVTGVGFSPVPHIGVAGGVFISTDTLISFPAVDIASGSEIASGIEMTGYTENPALLDIWDFESYWTPLGADPASVGEGPRTLRYGSIDRAGNQEVIHSTSLFVDGTAPLTSFAVDGLSGEMGGTLFIAATSTISLTTEDPISAGVASGISGTWYELDGDTVAVGSTPAMLSLSIGGHSLRYWSEDNVGNIEGPTSMAVVIDGAAPETTLLVNGQPTPGPITALEADLFSLTATDDLSGIRHTRYSVDGSSWQVFIDSFTLALGTHTLEYLSQDIAGNVEQKKTASIEIVTSTGPAPTEPPSAVTVTLISSYSATLSWNGGANPPATAYDVFYGPTSGPVCEFNPDPFTQSVQVTDTGAMVVGLNPFTSHAFKVCTSGLADGCAVPVVVRTLGPGDDPLANPLFTDCSDPPPPPPPSSGEGYGIGIDDSGNVWEVIYLNTGVTVLAKHDSQGVLISSVPLPGAHEEGMWSLRFDGSGNAYAVGAASGPATVGLDLAVYKVNPAADQVLDTSVFNSWGNGSDYAVDAAGDIYIAGAVEDPGTEELDLALWRYSLIDGQVSLLGSYSRAGLDAGLGIAYHNNELWVAGYSKNPVSGKLDHALWRFDTSGNLTGGPYLRPDYIPELNGGFASRVVVLGGSLFVSATRFNAEGNGDLAILNYDLSGNLISERIWRSDAGLTDYAGGLALMGTGLVAAGSAGTESQNNLTVWHLDAQGHVTSAEYLLNWSGTESVAVSGNDIWIAIRSTAPYRWVGGQALAGEEVLLYPAIPEGTGEGMAIAADGSDNLWEVVARQSGFSLDKFDGQGGFLASVSLPDASDDTDWSIRFDGSGNAYVVGAASGPATIGQDVAVYKVDPTGSQVLDVAVFNSWGNVLDMAMDSAGNLFIAGAVEDPATWELTLAMWRYTLADSQVSLIATYSRGGGMDRALGIAAHNNTLWVTGYSKDPGTGLIDHALWQFAESGTLVAGPHLRPGYLPDTEGEFFSRIVAEGNALYVAATKRNAQGDDDLAILKYDGSGNLLSERSWRSSANASDYARGLAAAGSGLVAAGAYAAGSDWNLAFWRLDLDGHVTSAETVPLLGSANALTVSGTNIWLAMGSSVPYRYTTGQALAGEEEILWTAPSEALSPSTGPIGIPFTISGTGFGSYAGANTRVKFGEVLAALSLWNDTTIKGTVPGISTGAYGVTVELQHPSSTTVIDAGTFNVTALVVAELVPSTGPIGIPFTITGTSFGPYNGANTKVLIGGEAAPLSIWNDTTIKGTVPGTLSSGTYSLQVGRHVGSTVSVSNVLTFEVTVPEIASLEPSSGPIGAPFTITGTSFGPYNGVNTRVLIGGTTCPLSLWNDTTIKGTIPGLSSGTVPVVVERAAGNGLARSGTWYFDVVVPVVQAVAPERGPIGTPFTVTGTGFGPYGGANTQVLIGTSPASLSLWNDTTIKGTVPGTLSPGPYDLVVRRNTSDGGSVESVPAAFQVAGIYAASIEPESGPIGSPFVITGTDFDSYGGANTRVLFNGTTAAMSLWTDTEVRGTVPALEAGVYEVMVEREMGDGISRSNTVSFTVAAPETLGIAPSSGPIGIPFTIAGTGFGPYNGANTRVLVGGALAPLTLWTDTVISGKIPGITPGTKEVFVERETFGKVARSATFYFDVVLPQAFSLSPSSGPIGAPFTFTGSGFGPYAGEGTYVQWGMGEDDSEAPLTLWNDTTIKGKVPGKLAPGIYEVRVGRETADEFSVLSEPLSFTILPLVASEVTPSSAPLGAPFTITGTGFGPYNGANTRVLIGGTTCSLTLWNETTIKGKVPALAAGSYNLKVERLAEGFTSASNDLAFTVVQPAISGIDPASAPIGNAFTLTGSGFGPYNGANTRVLIAGVPAPLTLWNDNTIKGRIPSVPAGAQNVVVERAEAGGGLVTAGPVQIDVVEPTISTITPSSGPGGTPYTLTGTGFGIYGGAATRVKIGGVATALSLWNDTTIRGLIPDDMLDGTYAMVVERDASGGTVTSNPINFTVENAQGEAMMASVPEWYNEAALDVPADTGGTVMAPSRAKVEVPAEALPEDTQITIDKADEADADARQKAGAQEGLARAGEAVEYGPAGTQFAKSVLIELPFDEGSIPPGKTIADLAVHYWNKLAMKWEELETVVDGDNKRMRAAVDHFSLFQPMVIGVAPAGLAQDLLDVLVYPVPWVPNDDVVDNGKLFDPTDPNSGIIFDNLTRSVKLQIYSMTGELVDEKIENNVLTGKLQWDGRNRAGREVASGAYVAVITDLGTNTKTTRRLVVIR